MNENITIISMLLCPILSIVFYFAGYAEGRKEGIYVGLEHRGEPQ